MKPGFSESTNHLQTRGKTRRMPCAQRPGDLRQTDSPAHQVSPRGFSSWSVPKCRRARSFDMEPDPAARRGLWGWSTRSAEDDTWNDVSRKYVGFSVFFFAKMTLSSVFLRLLIFRGGVERNVPDLCSGRTRSGALPPLFLFARGSRGGRLGPWGFQVRR